MSRFLVTTALEETWPDEGVPMLFLGEWCRRFSQKDHWLRRDVVVSSYHWDDRAKLQHDYLYLQDLHERLLQELTVQLNHAHGVDHGERYWRILIGPWLGYFTQMLFDRWTSIQQATLQHEISETIVLAGRGHAMVPNDMPEFIEFFLGDSWNHHIYAAILQQFTQVRCRPQDSSFRERALAEAGRVDTRRRTAKTRLTRWYARATSALARDSDAFLLGTSLPPLDEMRLYGLLKQIPQRWRSVPCEQTDFDGGRRQWLVRGESRNAFEECVRTMIPQQIPKNYLEGYSRLMTQVAELPWPKRPKFIWSSNSYNSDDVFKAWAAQKSESGAALVSGQHGGHYGIGRWSFNETHDLAICDSYLSWGWSSSEQAKVKPVGQLNSKRPVGISHAAKQRALLVTATMPQYSYVMYSAMVSRQWLDYFDDQCAFVRLLPKAIQDALTIRLYPQDFGWDQRARWSDRLPEVRFDDGSRSMDSLIRESRLYISTYNATTYLESFTMNVPTVIYWNPRHWELRDSAIPYFEDLQRVGIFHETPESAALHVAKIWADVDTWWNGTELREVLERFKAQYCSLPDNLLTRVQTALRDATLGLGAVKTRIDN